MGVARARGPLAVLAAAVVACGCEATSIDLVVDGDLRPGEDADLFVVFLRSEGELLHRQIQPLGAEAGLPQSLTVLPGARVRDSVDVEVAASRAGREVVAARRSVRFEAGRRVTVRICLQLACIGSASPDCLEGRCGAGGDGDGDADGDVDGEAERDADGDHPDGDLDVEADAEAPADGDLDGDAPCVPACEERECGDDGCGGSCPPGCVGHEGCSALTGRCVGPGEWVEIPRGTFEMGTPPTEAGRLDDETPHSVTLTRGFLMLSTEVTQGELAALVDLSPSRFLRCGADCPAERVTWHEALLYCNALSAREGLSECFACDQVEGVWLCGLDWSFDTPYDCPGYRLPTEAEWEWAARAGTTTATPAGDLDPAHLACESPNPVLDPFSWYCGTADGSTHPVATLTANPWGLFDVLGNVREWVADQGGDLASDPAVDPYAAPTLASLERGVRGCSWGNDANVCRSGNRFAWLATAREDRIGFRPVRTLP